MLNNRRLMCRSGARLRALVATGLMMSCLVAATLARPAIVAATCTGDCNGDSAVTIDDLLTMVNIALDKTTIDHCTAGDANGDQAITIDEILTAVNYALTSCPAGTPVSLVSGDYALTVAADARSFTLTRRDQVLLWFPADAFQLGTVDALDERSSYDPYFLESHGPLFPASPPASLTWRQVTAAAVTAAAADSVTIHLSFDDGRSGVLTLSIGAAGRFVATLVPDLPAGSPAVAWIRLRPRASSTEAFYGLGEWEDDVNQRGKSRPMQIEIDPSIESLYNEDHFPIPLLIGSRGWGLFVESKRLGEFDVATQEADLVEITYGTAQQSGDGLRFHLFAAERPLDITKHYYEVTGYPLLPAPWALGPWIWRDDNRDQAQVLDDIDKIRSLDLATSAIWIDRPYASAVNTFDFNPSQFPDPPSMIAAAHANGLRMALWHAPYVEPAAEPFRDEAIANNYFPPTSGLLLNGWSSPIDFTNPAAYDWWQGLLQRYTNMGIEGFKLDYGEDIAPGVQGHRNVWKFADGSDERTMHYGYTLLYHQIYAETLPASGGFLLCRAGRWGDQRNVSVAWPGDMDSTFTQHGEPYVDHSGQTHVGVGGLPATVIMGLGLGPSGFPFFGADTGGYRASPPSNELYIRWFEQTSLSSVMQVGDSSSETAWEFTADNGRDQQTLDLYRIYVRLHLRLFPYEWTYAQNIVNDGRPIQRALGLAYPEIGAHPSDEYLFGDDLLVAPVIEAAATTRHLIVPPGDWLDWWDGTLYPGGETGGPQVDVPAPLSKLPLFVHAGGIVPLLRPTIDTLSPTTLTPDRVDSYANDAGVLYVRVVPSDTASTFTLFDGARISQMPIAGGNEVTFHGGQTFTSGAVLEILRIPVIPETVTRNGTDLNGYATLAALEAASDGWFWEAATGGTLWVKVPDGDQQIDVR